MQFSEERIWQRNGVTNWKPELFEYLRSSPISFCPLFRSILFYQFGNFSYYLQAPLEIIAVWHGGMSFHGGLLGAVLAGLIFYRRRGLPFWEVADTVFVAAPVGLGLGRLGNFINGELFGRPASVPWAMIFPAGGSVPAIPHNYMKPFSRELCCLSSSGNPRI